MSGPTRPAKLLVKASRSRHSLRSCGMTKARCARAGWPPYGPLCLQQSLRLRPDLVRDIVARRGERITRGETLFRARRGLGHRTLHLVHVLLELADPLAERGADLRDALGAEQDQHDDEHDDQLAEPKVERHFKLLEKRPGNEIRDEHAEQAQ